MKTLWAIILIFVLTDNLTGQNTRKNTFPIRITVCDSINHEPLFLATISLTQDNHKIIAEVATHKANIYSPLFRQESIN